MAIPMTTTLANTLAAAYGAACTYAAVYTTAPTQSSPGTEPTGGTPPYARQPLTWSSPSGGQVTSSATHDIPGGATIVGEGMHGATSGSYRHGATITPQAFASQGTLLSSYTYTEA